MDARPAHIRPGIFISMVGRRSTVRFRNGAPQLDRITRKDLRRPWTSRVGPNGYRKGAFTAQSACSREVLSAGPGMPGGPISAGHFVTRGTGRPTGRIGNGTVRTGQRLTASAWTDYPKMVADRQPTASWHPIADRRAASGYSAASFRDRRWLRLPALTGRLGRPGAVMRGSRLGGLLLRPRPAVACHR